MTAELKIGMIGLDTSHAQIFTDLLNNPKSEYHLPGARVIAAFPGGSPDFELSHSRVGQFTDLLKNEYQAAIVDSPEAAAEAADAILLLSVDGRVHLEQFRAVASLSKPVFVDKPFAVKSAEAREIVELARRHRVPMMSASSLRYADGWNRELEKLAREEIHGVDCFGPAPLQETQPGLFWYGIHTVEMLYRALGPGCVQVTAATNDDHEFVCGVWKDGRIGTIRGNRKGAHRFGGVIHSSTGSALTDVSLDKRPYYVSLLEHILVMFRSGNPGVDPEETVETIRFIEAANESRLTGQTVLL